MFLLAGDIIVSVFTNHFYFFCGLPIQFLCLFCIVKLYLLIFEVLNFHFKFSVPSAYVPHTHKFRYMFISFFFPVSFYDLLLY